MKRVLAATFTVCLLAGCASTPSVRAIAGSVSPTGDPDPNIRNAVVQTENDWGRALLAGDARAFGRCLADEWTLTTSGGSTVTKSMALSDLASGALKIESFKLDDLSVRAYGETAIVRGLITERSSFRGADTSGKRRFTDVFVKRNGRWQAVASHESSAH